MCTQIQDLGYPNPGFGYPDPGLEYPNPGFGSQNPGFGGKKTPEAAAGGVPYF